LHCQNGNLNCIQNVQPAAEVCDGLDNNCAGGVDEGNPGGGAACTTGLPGPCGPGTITCQAGQLSCKQNVLAQPEICGNGIDDDCNGMGDPNVITYFTETFSNNSQGWTLGTEWAIGATSAGTCGDPPADHTQATADNGVGGVVLGGCYLASPLHPYYYLTSPIINTSAVPTVYLEFYRWLQSDYTPYVNNVIEVYNGSTWVQIWQSGPFPGIQDTAWVKQSFNITAYKNASMRVRFGHTVSSGAAFSDAGWNIDDLTITNAACN
jgi:hypothetical protein